MVNDLELGVFAESPVQIIQGCLNVNDADRYAPIISEATVHTEAFTPLDCGLVKEELCEGDYLLAVLEGRLIGFRRYFCVPEGFVAGAGLYVDPRYRGIKYECFNSLSIAGQLLYCCNLLSDYLGFDSFFESANPRAVAVSERLGFRKLCPKSTPTETYWRVTRAVMSFSHPSLSMSSRNSHNLAIMNNYTVMYRLCGD